MYRPRPVGHSVSREGPSKGLAPKRRPPLATSTGNLINTNKYWTAYFYFQFTLSLQLLNGAPFFRESSSYPVYYYYHSLTMPPHDVTVLKAQNGKLPVSRNTPMRCVWCLKEPKAGELFLVCARCRHVGYCVSLLWNSLKFFNCTMTLTGPLYFYSFHFRLKNTKKRAGRYTNLYAKYSKSITSLRMRSSSRSRVPYIANKPPRLCNPSDTCSRTSSVCTSGRYK